MRSSDDILWQRLENMTLTTDQKLMVGTFLASKEQKRMRSLLSGSSEVTFQSWIFKFLTDSGLWIGYVWLHAILFKYSGNTCSISVFIEKIVYILLSSISTCIRLIEFSARRMWSMKTGSSFALFVGCSTLLLSNECFFYRLCLTIHGDG
jgi:hypothetical protein